MRTIQAVLSDQSWHKHSEHLNKVSEVFAPGVTAFLSTTNTSLIQICQTSELLESLRMLGQDYCLKLAWQEACGTHCHSTVPLWRRCPQRGRQRSMSWPPPQSAWSCRRSLRTLPHQAHHSLSEGLHTNQKMTGGKETRRKKPTDFSTVATYDSLDSCYIIKNNNLTIASPAKFSFSTY